MPVHIKAIKREHMEAGCCVRPYLFRISLPPSRCGGRASLKLVHRHYLEFFLLLFFAVFFVVVVCGRFCQDGAIATACGGGTNTHVVVVVPVLCTYNWVHDDDVRIANWLLILYHLNVGVGSLSLCVPIAFLYYVICVHTFTSLRLRGHRLRGHRHWRGATPLSLSLSYAAASCLNRIPAVM